MIQQRYGQGCFDDSSLAIDYFGPDYGTQSPFLWSYGPLTGAGLKHVKVYFAPKTTDTVLSWRKFELIPKFLRYCNGSDTIRFIETGYGTIENDVKTEVNDHSFSFSQNPFSSELYLHFSSNITQPTQYAIYDMLGRKVAEDVISIISPDLTIAINLSNGIYFILCRDTQHSFMHKFSVRK